MEKRKLIEVALPLDAINEASVREKSIRHGHPSTLHLWWARRPLAACRAVIWASLVDDPSSKPELFPTKESQDKERERLFEILRQLVKWENSNDKSVLDGARAEIRKCYKGEIPPIIDPFAGGGSIPLEAKRLGLTTYASDLNPVAVLINRVMLEFPNKFDGCPPVHPNLQNSELKVWHGLEGLAADIEAYGKWMRDEAEKRIGHLYPKARNSEGKELTPIAWIWARTVESPNPSWNGHVPLVASWILRPQKLVYQTVKPVVWVEPKIDQDNQTILYNIRTGGEPNYSRTIERGIGTCLATGSTIPNDWIVAETRAGRMRYQLMAVVAEGSIGKEYISVADKTIPNSYNFLSSAITGEIEPGMSENVTRYGLDYFEKLFTHRQLTALATFSQLTLTARKMLEQDISKVDFIVPDSYTEALTALLNIVVSKCADYWSSLCVWYKGSEVVAHVFGRHAIGMVWDFAEANPFSNSSGNWMSKINSVQQTVKGLPTTGRANVFQANALDQVTKYDKSAGVVVTDPPYYNNICYAKISDFFYVWLRKNLKDTYPNEFSTLLTPKDEELIADSRRHGSKTEAKKHFELGMAEFMRGVATSQHPKIPATLFYAYKAQENKDGKVGSTGWDTFLQSIIDSGMAITATWPMRTELSNRSNAIKANALASSVVLVCRPRSKSAPLASRSEFMSALQTELPDAVRLMQSGNIAPVDLPQSAIGPGIGVFSRYAKVVEADGSKMPVSEALALINDVLGEILDGEEAELDAETRFALAWYEQYGFEPESSGNADSIARAKNTSLQGIEDSGIGEARAGKFRLLKREELDPEWSPTTDSRLTIWEATQHMVLALEDSELRAAEILRELGGKADSVFQLISVIYQKADHKGESQEAACYNGLAMAWPTLRAQSSEPQAEQTALEGTESQP